MKLYVLISKFLVIGAGAWTKRRACSSRAGGWDGGQCQYKVPPFLFEGWIEIQYMMSYKCSVPKTFIQYLLESFSQTLIRRFFTAKHPEIAAKFEEKEKEDGLIKPDQVKSFSNMN